MKNNEGWFWECGVVTEPSSDFCRLCNGSREKDATRVHSEEASGRAPGWYCPRCKTLKAGIIIGFSRFEEKTSLLLMGTG
jgi:hypothetical protein